MWEAAQGTPQNSAGEGRKSDLRDDGELGWRAFHVVCLKLFPVKFCRQQDAERAVAILNDRCPCDSMSEASDVEAAINQEFGSFEQLAQHLVEHCCAW